MTALNLALHRDSASMARVLLMARSDSVDEEGCEAKTDPGKALVLVLWIGVGVYIYFCITSTYVLCYGNCLNLNEAHGPV